MHFDRPYSLDYIAVAVCLISIDFFSFTFVGFFFVCQMTQSICDFNYSFDDVLCTLSPPNSNNHINWWRNLFTFWFKLNLSTPKIHIYAIEIKINGKINNWHLIFKYTPCTHIYAYSKTFIDLPKIMNKTIHDNFCYRFVSKLSSKCDKFVSEITWFSYNDELNSWFYLQE